MRISKSTIVKLSTGILCAMVVGLICANKDDIIVGASIRTYNFLIKAGTVVTILNLGWGAYGFGTDYFIKNRCSRPAKEPSLNIKKSISKEELDKKLDELRTAWSGLPGEYRPSYNYALKMKEQLEKITSIENTLNMLTNNNDEESLNEVFNVLNSVERQMITNIVSAINHIKLELSIDGYDTSNIDEYLGDNEELISQCSDLIKASLLYMDGKSNSRGIQEYVNSMVETLNRLKEKD